MSREEFVTQYMPGEEAAIRQVIALAKQHGYGNLMMRLHEAWNAEFAARGEPLGAHTVGPALLCYERLGFKGGCPPVDLLVAYEATAGKLADAVRTLEWVAQSRDLRNGEEARACLARLRGEEPGR